MAATVSPGSAAVTSASSAPGRRSTVLLDASSVLAASAVAVVVIAGGSPGWSAVRVATALLAGLATVMLARSGRVRAGRVVAVILGLVALVVGVAIGVPHALARSWVTATAGVVALVAGVGLIAGVVAGTWRERGRWARVGTVAAALLVAQFLVFPVGQAVFATNRAPTPPPERTPADVGLTYRDVTLITREGIRLAAWYVPSTNGAAVILRHGAGSTRQDVLPHAAVLAAHGYGVLAMDARGHGASGGQVMDFGWFGDADIAPAVEHVRRSSDVDADRIGLVGLSMGGEEAIGAAASLPGVRAVVAEGATGRRGADWLALQPTGIGRWPSTAFYAIQDATAALLSGAARPTDLRRAVVGATPRPMLLVAAGGVPREVTAARRLHEAAPTAVRVWEVPDAGHIQGLATAPGAWEERVIGFLDETLGD